MDSFTFVTLTYNHEKYIIEHLESIKSIVLKYGDSIKIDLIISDDASKDKTVSKIKDWIAGNDIFSNVILIENKENLGVVKNLVSAVNRVQTRQFKFLAGDDIYVCRNIFSLYDDIDGKLLITPVLVFGKDKLYVKKIRKNLNDKFSMMLIFSTYNRQRYLLKYDNLIPAPGVFVSGDIIRNPGLQKYILKYKYVDDFPMWFYILNNIPLNVHVLDSPYIHYRVGNGITSNSADYDSIREDVQKDLNMIWKDSGNKFHGSSKCTFIYRLYFWILRTCGKIRSFRRRKSF